MTSEYFSVPSGQTIAAIATPPGAAAVGMVRMSGEQALMIADKVFTPISSGGKICERDGYTACLGKISDEKGPIDEVMAFIYRAPKSYTGENVVEFCSHGSSLLVGRVLDALLSAGAVAAQPGEFTRRAFENGKLSLDRAESVMALINSHSEGGARAALAAKDGALWQEISACCERLSDIAAHLSAWLDYPDEGVEDLDRETLGNTLHEVRGRLLTLGKTYSAGRVLREGVDVVIAGRPNVGKSTLMNLLSGSQRSIVTDIPGTTRDVVEDRVYLGQFLLRLSDTAGLRDSADPVEMIGVQKARNRLESCDVTIAMFDNSRRLDEDDLDLISRLNGRAAVAIVNKTDLEGSLDITTLRQSFGHVVEMSAKSGGGVEELAEVFSKLLDTDNLDTSAAILVTARQLECVLRAADSLEQASAALEQGAAFDALWVCIDEGLGALLELTGQKVTTAVVDKVFEKFCVGK